MMLIDKPGTTLEAQSLHAQLVRVCLPLMTDYQRDLVEHDKTWIEGHPGIPFLHWTRTTGTHLVGLYPHDDKAWPPMPKKVPYLFGEADRVHILEQTHEIAKWFGSRSITTRACHHFDGRRLHEINIEVAVRITRDYVASLKSIWRRTRAC